VKKASIAVVVSLLALMAAVVPAGAVARPEILPLPDGWQPEGIATRGNSFFVGSIPTGDVYRGNLKTGDGARFIDAPDGRSAIGLEQRRGVLFVAGGGTGQGYAYDIGTGEELAVFELTSDETFVNDVVATKDAAYFTDSVNPRLYRVPIEGGSFGDVETLEYSGDLVYEDGFNANGIDATRNGKWLIVVQSNTGELFRVDPDSGATTLIDLGGESVPNGDGLLLEAKRRLWVVQNQLNQLALVKLRKGITTGRVKGRFTHESFDVPTTVDSAGKRLAVVNARFGVEDPESAEYWVSQIKRPRP
jgi:sugar lactone lactonase YvrE